MAAVHEARLQGGGAGGAIRCVLVGDEPLVAQCAEIARAHGLEIVLVSTTNPIVRDDAIERGIPVVGARSELAAGLDAHPADVLLSIANLRLISDEVLAMVQLAINYHDGPLPGYAGLNVTTWALLGGEHEHAITWHVMTSDVDGGEVVLAEHFPIRDDETAFSLNARCYEAALASFPRIAAAIASGVVATTPQPDGEHRMFMRHDRPAVLLDPMAPAAATARAVRALDLGHRIRNGVGAVRWLVDGAVYVVDAATTAPATSGAAPGTVVSASGEGVRVATADGDLVITAISTPEGAAADLAATAAAHGIAAGTVLAAPPQALADALRSLEPAMSKDELFWLDRLCLGEPVAPAAAARTGERVTRRVERPADADDAAVVAAVAIWLVRVLGAEATTFALTDAAAREALASLSPLARPGVARVELGAQDTFGDVRSRVAQELATVATRRPLLRDALGRDPRTRGHDLPVPVLVEVGDGAGDGTIAPEVALRIAVRADELVVETRAGDDPRAVHRMAEQLHTLLQAAVAQPTTLADELPILGPTELAFLDSLNRTDRDHDRTATIDRLFREQVERTPDAPALSFGDRTLTYAELRAAADALAARLAAAGVGRGDRVGIAVPRGVEMLVGVLATLQVGAAYLPLDPSYPMDRLGFMVDDAGIAVLLATGSTATELGRPALTVIDPTQPDPTAPPTPPAPPHDPTDLAYVIYTSGSTGLPKGVMLEHRQVVNFFVAMDEVIDHDPPGTWLAVTSLSFDISVLELLWTLARGFHIVLKADRGIPAAPSSTPAVTAAPTGPVRPVTFSLFYFAAGEETASDGYHLLLDSARFADRHGFEAVWTPERHFHAFGGAYPNPSVAGAALAAVTEHVRIRAGSVVLPLHSPIRVAEEWAVVDNLSRGRVGISFAAGWQPNDFVLNPTAYATAKQDLARSMEVVQRLWRGETVTLPGHDGGPVEVRTLPRPVQPELPMWLTSAGTPATFERAGKLGVNVLTHLLGQSVEQLAENIARYRAAWAEAGHPGEGQVTLMLHTYLDRDAATAKEVAREPMKAYLNTAVGLLRDVATAFPTFTNRGKVDDDLLKTLSPEELDQLLEMAAHRYLSSSGLFGTPEDAAAMVETVSAAGVDEVACLIDFGVATDQVFSSLELLLEAKRIVDGRRAEPVQESAAVPQQVIDPADDTVAALVARHGVTHLQCTPSLAAMLVADPADREALRKVQHLMLGGEALPTALATELRELLPGRFTNMYGPTETTIWSLTHELDGPPGSTIPIGTAIANTTLFVLDPKGRRLPVGTFGELHIGGEGVARGYHNRPELTAERFVDRLGMGRVYATGDIVRVHPDGYIEFAGRADNQVKIRGHRIELGEIEAVIDRHPDVVQSVVVARQDVGDPKLVAYVVLHHDAAVTGDALRKHVGEHLPDAMVPSSVVRLEAFPLTPNGKIDRKALPVDAPSMDGSSAAAPAITVEGDTERLIAEIWSSELDRPVGRDDNFFDIGGHSLLAVKVYRRICDATAAPLALTDVFRFPTVRSFAAHLAGLQGSTGPAEQPTSAPPAAPTGTDRGAMRRRALARRGGQDGNG
jgi:natural product biosynthesis luciferase-like monooxygenase protein